MSRHSLLSAFALLLALTVLLTWPQALHLGTKVAAHDDPLFSIWRLAWIAHALPTDPWHLFDANIFHPHLRTLAYSDAMMLEGALAAPFLWVHANPIAVYNVMLLAGIVSSGLGMFLLARHLTGDDDAALVSAAVFTLLPYRVEHFMHLELQWTVWMPLAFWAVHRTFESGSVRFGALIGLFIGLQTLSSVYYGAFLSVLVAALAILLAASEPHKAIRGLSAMSVGVFVAGLLTLPYAMPYIENTRMLGPREPGEIADFSARLDSFLLTPQQNWIWGWTAFKFGGNELHLFTGVVAIVLALLAFARRPRTMAWIYCALALLAASLSLGANGSLYRWLNEYVWVFRGFRAPARFAILSGCALSVLAGFGFLALRGLLRRNPMRRALLIVVLVAVGIECGSAPMILTDVPRRVPDVYKFLQTLDRTVIVEFPMVDYDLTPLFMYGSTFHWHRLVNGYSGYAPPDYRVTRECMRTFPDDPSIARLRELGTQYVLVHQAYYTEDDFVDLMDQIIRRTDLVSIGHYKDWLSETYIFQLKASERAQ